jgi:hypothetical protein
MTPSDLMHRLLDVVETTELDAPYEDFVRVSERLLALLISRLPPPDREAMLQGIEGGTLRQAVGQFPTAQPSKRLWH